jgi:hypothetical protein
MAGTVIVPVQQRAAPVVNMKPVLNGTLLMHPQLPSIASNLPVTNAVLAAQAAQTVAATGQPPPAPSISDLLDLEQELYLDPINVMRRHFRVYLLPASIAGGLLTASPQRDCVPFQLHIPSGSAAGATIQQLQSGVDQYFATADNLSAAIFGENVAQSGLAMLRPILTVVGKDMGANTTVAAGTRCGFFCFDLSNSGVLAAPTNRPMAMGSKVLSVHAAAAVNNDLFPQKSFRPRRLSINDKVANFNTTIDATHGISVNSILVGNEPQTESDGPLPATMFALTMLGGFIDGDVAKVGKKVTIQTVNNEAANDIELEWTWWGDTLDD